jgi:hypothetical protein
MQRKMRRMPFVAMVAVVLGVVFGGTAFAQSDPIMGSWKLNLAMSKYDPGPPPMGDTRVYEPWDTDGVKLTANLVRADGTHVTAGFSAHYDGRDYKDVGVPDYDTIALKRVNGNTIEETLKKGGKVVGRGRHVVSKNGRMFTLTLTWTNANGQKAHRVSVYDKQ